MPTDRSLLAPFRMLSVYFLERKKTRNRVNLDKLEPMKLLTTYKENKLDKFKADQNETIKKRRNGFKRKRSQ
jgi:hypothetical protein